MRDITVVGNNRHIYANKEWFKKNWFKSEAS